MNGQQRTERRDDAKITLFEYVCVCIVYQHFFVRSISKCMDEYTIHLAMYMCVNIHFIHLPHHTVYIQNVIHCIM